MRDSPSLPSLAAAALLAALWSAPLAAQQGVVVGFVRDSAGSPVPEAAVLVSPDHRTRADSAGRFVVTGVKAGLREVRIRRVGFMPYDATLRFRADGSDTVRADLTVSPRKLPTIVTRAERQCLRYKYEGLMCRKADGRGVVFTVDELDEEQPEFLADLAERIDGLRVDFGVVNQWQTRFPRPVGRCLVQLVNGLRPLPGWTPWARHAVDDVAGLEIYRPTEIPPEYRFEAQRGAERCWLVNVWTWDKLDG